MSNQMNRASWMSERFWRRSRLAQSAALLGVLALAATGTFAVEEASRVVGNGLGGIFSTTPPEDLSAEEFAKLDGNWSEWSKGTAEAVTDFYAKLETSDAATQRKSLSNLKIKQDVMRRALNDSRYDSLRGPLTSLYNSLTLRIDFAEAALDTLDLDGKQIAASKTRVRSSSLLSSIQNLENYLASVGNGSLWLTYFHIPELKSALSADPEGPAGLAAAAKTQMHLMTRNTALDASQKAFTNHGTFQSLSSTLDQYVAAVRWTNPAEATEKLRADLKSLSTALDTYASSGEKAGELRDSFARARYDAPDNGDRLASTLQKHLFNYNLRVLVSEAFLNRLMSQNRVEQGPVNDFILGANVYGNQITNTAVDVDLKPSSNTVRFDLRLNGNINSNTQGVTPQATVYTIGNHTFNARKEINFDGQTFSTMPATIAVSPRNTTTGISTQMSGIPIIGRIAQRIATDQVEAKRGEAESIAAGRVQDNVLPRFNQDVDRSFAEQGDKLNREVFSGLRATKLFPDTYNYQSTDQLMTMNARVMSPHQIGGDLPDSRLMSVTGATALVHETALNNAIDQMDLAGQTVTEAELKAKIEAFLTKALNRPYKFQAETPVEATDEDEKALNGIIFAAVDPIRIRVTNDELTIVIRAGFKQEGKEDIPTREITVPISLEAAGNQILAKRGNVIVAAAEGQGGGVAINAVVRKKIQSVLPDRAVDSKIEIKTPEKIVISHVTKIKLVDGWLVINID
ncbi:MAG: hypothetical protein DWI02_12570 [Planctomycetota bacterium]|nr:MAG: hypothetical protein DWI02_12570 [Planctomycetota bacterium]